MSINVKMLLSNVKAFASKAVVICPEYFFVCQYVQLHTSHHRVIKCFLFLEEKKPTNNFTFPECGLVGHNITITISERRPSSCKNVLHTFNNFVRHNPSLRLSMTFLNPPGYNNYLACWCSRCRAAMLACFRKPVHGFVS